jgi:hypothetical protein
LPDVEQDAAAAKTMPENARLVARKSCMRVGCSAKATVTLRRRLRAQSRLPRKLCWLAQFCGHC